MNLFIINECARKVNPAIQRLYIPRPQPAAWQKRLHQRASSLPRYSLFLNPDSLSRKFNLIVIIISLKNLLPVILEQLVSHPGDQFGNRVAQPGDR